MPLSVSQVPIYIELFFCLYRACLFRVPTYIEEILCIKKAKISGPECTLEPEYFEFLSISRKSLAFKYL